MEKFLLATSDFGEEIQGELDLYVTNNRLNEATFRRRLDPIPKKHYKKQKSNRTFVEHFDAQNPVIGSLIKEVDISKEKGFE